MNNTAALPGQSCLVSLHTSAKVFSDEIDKFRFLQALGSIMNHGSYHALAFSLLDDSLYILFTDTKPAEARGAVRECFDDRFLPDYLRCHSEDIGLKRTLSCHRVSSPAELAECVGDVHTKAQKLGLVRRPKDYFWSSMPTYTGFYVWDFINPEITVK